MLINSQQRAKNGWKQTMDASQMAMPTALPKENLTLRSGQCVRWHFVKMWPAPPTVDSGRHVTFGIFKYFSLFQCSFINNDDIFRIKPISRQCVSRPVSRWSARMLDVAYERQDGGEQDHWPDKGDSRTAVALLLGTAILAVLHEREHQY